MSGFFILFLVALLALAGYNVAVFASEAGTFADRLSAAFQRSMTMFAGVWGIAAVLVSQAGDMITAMTGDPGFAALSGAARALIPAQYLPAVSIAGMALMMWARQRTLGK